MVCVESGENWVFCGSSGIGKVARLKSCWRKVKNSSVGSQLCSGSDNKSRISVDSGSFWVVLSAPLKKQIPVRPGKVM